MFRHRSDKMKSIVAVICFVGAALTDECFFVINKDFLNYTAIPQDMDTSDTCLSIVKNDIAVLDNTSFQLYRELYKIILDRNPLVEIKVGTFDKNSHLKIFQCNVCKIASFPPDFGPATLSLTSLRLKFGLKHIDVLRQVELQRFHKLKQVEIMGIKTADLNTIYLPPTIT